MYTCLDNINNRNVCSQAATRLNSRAGDTLQNSPNVNLSLSAVEHCPLICPYKDTSDTTWYSHEVMILEHHSLYKQS